MALLLCAGLVLIGCTDGPLGENENTEQDGNGGNEDGGGTGDTNAIINTSGGVTLSVSLRNLTETGVAFYGKARLEENYTADSFGILYSEDEAVTAANAEKIPIVDIYGEDYTVSTSSLKPNTTYYYTSYIKQGNLYKYGEVKSFVTVSLVAPTLNAASDITEVSSTISGVVSAALGTAGDLQYGFQYCVSEDFSSDVISKKITSIDSENKFSLQITYLVPMTTYYYRSYIKMNGVYAYGELESFRTLEFVPTLPAGYTNLASTSSANCYIVSQSGSYGLPVLKGNASSDWLYQTIESDVLWESFGTSAAPSVGSLVKSVSYKDGYIAFQTADTFKEGNAVIAAKDASGNILWSWHIWFTDLPQGQIYYNNAGTMMDRNLGAISATPGDAGALGLLYQWGRKDPFLGSSSISSNTVAKSTITWPSAVSSSSSTGTIEYATSHPTTFITSNSITGGWYYTRSLSTYNTRWTTSETSKSIYDPCPSGWRVPDGGANSVWSKALGSSSAFDHTYNIANEGMNFSGKFGSASTIWYPASGCLSGVDGSPVLVGSDGEFWSASPSSSNAYCLSFSDRYLVFPSEYSSRALGKSVRCVRE